MRSAHHQGRRRRIEVTTATPPPSEGRVHGFKTQEVTSNEIEQPLATRTSRRFAWRTLVLRETPHWTICSLLTPMLPDDFSCANGLGRGVGKAGSSSPSANNATSWRTTSGAVA